jgi:hypothetical protein
VKSAPKASIVELQGLAAAYHDRVTNYGEGFQTAESLAFSTSNQTGQNIVKHANGLIRAGNIASEAKESHGVLLTDALLSIQSGKEKYLHHMRPDSPVRKTIMKSLVADVGHAALATTATDFARSGYSYGLTEVTPSFEKSGLTPIEAKAADRTITYIPDHLIVDGHLTAMGKVYEKWVRSDKTSQELAHIEAKRWSLGDKAEQAKLENFIAGRLEYYGRLSPDEFNVYKRAMAVFQAYDKIGLDKVNRATEITNKANNTYFADISYEPWRLDSEVSSRITSISDNPMLLDTYKDADRIMGQRYGTTPENQIYKAQNSKIDINNVEHGPEDIVLNRFTRLINDVYSRYDRAALSRAAQNLVYEGFEKQAQIVRDYIIAPNSGIPDVQNFWESLSRHIDQSNLGDASYVLGPLGIVIRQVSNPFAGLASGIATTIEQGAQQGITQLTGRPTPKNFLSSMRVIAEFTARSIVETPKNMIDSFRLPMNKLNTETNGAEIKLSGPLLDIAEEVYAGAVKRGNPLLMARLSEARRENPAAIKEMSYWASTSRYMPEAITAKILFLQKESSENRGARLLVRDAMAIFQVGLDKYKEGGLPALSKHLNEYMVGPLTNQALTMSIADNIMKGNVGTAARDFGTYYVHQNLGTWAHSNIPKNVRWLARFIPGADQFYTAATLGTHRSIMAIANMDTLTTRQKAYSIASVLATVGTVYSLSSLSQNTGIMWFDKLSPSKYINVAASLLNSPNTWDKSTQAMIASLGKGVSVRGGATQGLRVQQTQALLSLISEVMLNDDPTHTKEEREKRQKDMVDRFVKAIVNQTFVAPITRTAGTTPKEAAEFWGNFIEGMRVSTFDKYDADVLEASNMAAYRKSEKALLSKEFIEQETGVPLFNPVEQLSYDAMRIFADHSLAAQEELWAGLGGYALPPAPSRDAAVLAQGARGTDQHAAVALRLIEEAIRRYELRKAKHDELITGQKIHDPAQETGGPQDSQQQPSP